MILAADSNGITNGEVAPEDIENYLTENADEAEIFDASIIHSVKRKIRQRLNDSI